MSAPQCLQETREDLERIHELLDDHEKAESLGCMARWASESATAFTVAETLKMTNRLREHECRHPTEDLDRSIIDPRLLVETEWVRKGRAEILVRNALSEDTTSSLTCPGTNKHDCLPIIRSNQLIPS
jgi:hypothetical protein